MGDNIIYQVGDYRTATTYRLRKILLTTPKRDTTLWLKYTPSLVKYFILTRHWSKQK